MKILFLVFSIFTLSFTTVNDVDDHQMTSMDEAVKGNKSFARFLSHFKKVDIPKDIDHIKLQEYKSSYLDKQRGSIASAKTARNDIKNFIPEAKGSKFSRIGPPMVAPLDRFYPDDQTLAVTYLVRYHYNLSGFDIKIALFDLKGNRKVGATKSRFKSKSSPQNAMVIASFDSEQTILCSFENLKTIAKFTLKNNWEKDTSEFGVQDNSISNYEKLNSEFLNIEANGEIKVAAYNADYASIK